MQDLFFIIPLGLAMGFVTSISGGGGVFGVPTMLAFGLPPINALALNRVSDLGFLSGSIKNYLKTPEFDLKLAALISLPLTMGAFCGAMFSTHAPTAILQWIIIAAIFVGVALLLYPVRPKPEHTKPHYYIGFPVLLAVGFWSGMVAMAGSTFAVIALVLFFHRSYLGGKAIDVVASVPETIISAFILAMHSTIDCKVAIAMFISSIVGGYAGSHLAIRKGSPFVRFGMVAMALVMAGKVLLFNILHVF